MLHNNRHNSQGGPQQPSLLQAPNLSFHSCLYFSHHSSSHVERVSPQRMILYRSCSSAVHATPSISPFVTMPRLRRPCRLQGAQAAPKSASFNEGMEQMTQEANRLSS